MRITPPLLFLLAACAGTPTVPHTPVPPAPAPAPAPVARPAEPAPSPVAYRIEDGKVVLPVAVAFAAGQAVPTPESDAALRHVVGFLAAKTDITKLRIEVHGDGSAADEQRLTEARALAIQVRLVELGADGARLLPVGFGASKPVADGTTPAGKAQNRRVEFRPAELRGKAIGGMPLDGGGRVAEPGGR